MPEVIVSYQDPRFSNRFWTQFFEILGMDLRLSIAFHPQTDSQSEVTICMVENFLGPYVELHPLVWSKSLNLAKFAANDSINVPTGYTLFYLNNGESPASPGHL